MDPMGSQPGLAGHWTQGPDGGERPRALDHWAVGDARVGVIKHGNRYGNRWEIVYKCSFQWENQWENHLDISRHMADLPLPCLIGG